MDITSYPLIVLKELNAWTNIKEDYIIRIEIKSSEHLIKYQGKTHPNFYFCINNSRVENNQVWFNISYRPSSENSIQTASAGLTSINSRKRFDDWKALVKEYSQVQNPQDDIADKILKQSEEEIFDWFENIDEDAENKAYDTKTQFLIDKIAQNVIDAVNVYNGPISDEDKQILLQEAFELIEHQTNYTKKETIRRISKLWARAKKVSIGLFKEVLKDLIKDGIKSILKGEIQYLLQ